ncbi:hypothetical protein BG003_010625, partial [Podila horticola]
ACEKEDHGDRPYQLRTSKSGDGKPCITGHKKCCADADTELHRAACKYSDNDSRNPDSDDDDEDYVRFLMKKGFRVQHNQYEYEYSVDVAAAQTNVYIPITIASSCAVWCSVCVL